MPREKVESKFVITRLKFLEKKRKREKKVKGEEKIERKKKKKKKNSKNVELVSPHLE
jgi:hypothetical protein